MILYIRVVCRNTSPPGLQIFLHFPFILFIIVRWPCHEQLLFCQFLGHLACFLSYHHTRLIVLFICLYETSSFFQTRSLFVFVLLEHVPCYSCIFFHSPEVTIVISPLSAVFFIADISANVVIFTWVSLFLSIHRHFSKCNGAIRLLFVSAVNLHPQYNNTV